MFKLETYLKDTTPAQRENALLEQGDKAVSQLNRAMEEIQQPGSNGTCINTVEDILLER